jgi:hypothetical protein
MPTLLVVWLALVSIVGAEPAPRSAHRDLGTSWKIYRARVHDLSDSSVPSSPESLAVAYDEAHLRRSPGWSPEILNSAFQKFRDQRFLIDAVMPAFLRRITWLFPDDGCYARAGLVIRQALAARLPAPDKLFVFGDLSVKTENSPDGAVGWWYHVAPVVEVGGEKWILDPAIEPHHPLRLPDWLARMSAQPGQLQVAECSSGTYTPIDNCTSVSDGQEALAEQDEAEFLHDEWSRLLSLGRVPEKELGDQPPWLTVPAL